jgi:hypothetical protein
MTERPLGRGPWRLILPAGLIAAVALVYFAFLPVSYSFDGTVFGHMLRRALLRGEWLSLGQVHHLLYVPLAYWLYRGLQALAGYQVLEFFHLQMISLLFGAATLALAGGFLRRLGLDLGRRLAGMAVIAFSYAFWSFSVDAEMHIPGLFFVMAGMLLLSGKENRPPALAAAAACLIAAAGFHLTNALAIPAALAILAWRRAPWRRVALFACCCAAGLLLMYASYGLLGGAPVLRAFRDTLFGADRYAGYHVAFSRPLSPATLIASLLSVKTALVFGGGAPAWAVFAATAALLLLGLLAPTAARPLSRALLAWPLLYLAFFSWWDPANMEFKIHVVVPLLLIALSGLARLKPLPGAAVGFLLAGALLANNLASGIAPQADIGRNTDYQAAMAIRRATPENAQVVISGRLEAYGHGKIYIPYFAHREVVILDWLLGKGSSLPAIAAELSRRAGAGQPIFALDEAALPNPALERLLSFHRVGEGERRLWLAALRWTAVAELPGGRRLFRLQYPELKDPRFK